MTMQFIYFIERVTTNKTFDPLGSVVNSTASGFGLLFASLKKYQDKEKGR